ncbi:MAG: MFS transporter [Rhodospirillaceae bacterium]|nr:MFS transporter [Rhodospirillaceae bacterium]|tara:strand:+ start:8324 stop:9535 length:1212 start_codon:yes stop_codon:yes gene_type:complete
MKRRQFGAAALISFFCSALVLNLLGFMTLAAVLPALISEWGLTSTEAGWLGGIYFAGYVVAVPILTALTDRIDPKRIYLGSALLAGVSSIGFAVAADGFWAALLLRFLAGAGLGGTYMPGLKALTDNLQKSAQSRGVTYYTGVFALGTAFSFLIGGEVAEQFGWRWTFATAGAGCFVGALIIIWVLPSRIPRDGTISIVTSFRAVLQNQSAMSYMISYFGYAWEVFAFRVWVVAFLFFSQMHNALGPEVLNATVWATIFALAGVAANMAFGELAIAFDRRRVLIFVSVISVLAGVSIGLLSDSTYGAVVSVCFVFAMLTSGRNAPTNAGLVNAVPEHLRGTAMAVHATIGYAGGIVGPLAAGIALDVAGGIENPRGWTAAFLAISAGAVISALALYCLNRRRD